MGGKVDNRKIRKGDKMTSLEILMADGCTRAEAERHLERGAVIFERQDFETHFEDYMEEWGIERDSKAGYRDMIDKKIPMTGWGVVEGKEGGTWYISYVL